MAEPRLKGRVALVTGAGSGMGQACVLALAAEGADVGLVGRTAATLEQTAALTRRLGVATAVATGDVASADEARRAVEAVVALLGRVDVLVNSAGTNTALRGLDDTPDDDWDRVVATNLTGI